MPARPQKQPPVKERALALASRKLRSRKALQQKLVDEGYDADAIEPVLDRLKEIHLIDDGTLARSIGRHYKDRGNRFITQKLREKGIVADDHEAAIEELPDELERAIAAGEKKLRSLKNLEPRAAAQKLYQHLAMRGFSGALVQKAVRQLTKAEVEE